MRKTVTGMALVAATAALLTGCGSDSGPAGGKGGAEQADDKAPVSTSPSAAAHPGHASHTVTLEVDGTGKTNVMYNAASQGFEEKTLPWTLTETVELTAAEQKVGYLVTVVPGSVMGADGMLKQAPCVIKVDGKRVVDNAAGKNEKGCTYTIKG
ncbi:hypothetical protein E6P78_02615 [Streptomyces sp. A0958]|uniref:hypothetical protein n=1 Tax=Streptomyces sp. A0958 TaxID=2563101 RepID=UPI00109EB01B|nr:hypothetical protein [Streptomyces sp. A0958]THA72192.1 hypothetical protein E6P78_02615 [Streptomyces sp. A0958]